MDFHFLESHNPQLSAVALCMHRCITQCIICFIKEGFQLVSYLYYRLFIVKYFIIIKIKNDQQYYFYSKILRYISYKTYFPFVKTDTQYQIMYKQLLFNVKNEAFDQTKNVWLMMIQIVSPHMYTYKHHCTCDQKKESTKIT